ncbi:dihydroxyacetone kinase phosphoryl donor subunit DhaM, partial [Amycolatopsis solani]|uniref:dihydroxyacetone kinase phosphoryl donor subunit DhaM n=1 Tax=Amycolatopsis solani TaxID=3028615 RepID=UPI0025B1D19D
MSVGIVLVSHSAKLAEGLAELAAQMAPDVTIVPAGGLADGSIGTDYDEVVAATQRADRGDGVVLLYDLGSAQMTAELAVESLADPSAAVVADGPLVEGAIAAAVAAQSGQDRKAVAEAGGGAGGAPPPPP